MRIYKLIATGIVLLPALLAGCGGGSSGSSSGGLTGTQSANGAITDQPAASPPPVSATASSAQGVYQGTVSNGRQQSTLVLDNDQIFIIYGDSVFGVLGFIQGNGKSNNGSFSSTDIKDFHPAGEIISGSLSASYSPNTSFNGAIFSGSDTVSFTGTTSANTLYNYNTTANPANIVGHWNLSSLQGNSVALDIASGGTFVGASGGCSFNGTIAPRASGKNVFDMALTFGALPCGLPDQSVSGIAFEYPLADGKRELVIEGTNAARTSGMVLLGAR